MTPPDLHPDERTPQDLQDAYRSLPPVEPDAALDARVRAAVAAEVASSKATVPGQRGAVLPFRRWRRAALSFAAAAAVLVAIGIGQLQQPAHTLAPAAVPAEAGKMSAATPTVAPAAAPLHSAAAPQPPPNYRPAPVVATPPADLPMVAGPPPPQAIVLPESPASYALRQRGNAASSATEARAEVDAALATESQALGRVSAAAPNQSTDDTVVFDKIRRLLAEQHRDAARLQLKRWREVHPRAPLPPDLMPLAAEADH
jgi:hypothetical protein